MLSPRSHPLVASDLGPGCFRKPYPKASLTSLLSDGTSVCDEVRLPIQGGESGCLGNHCASDTVATPPPCSSSLGKETDHPAFRVGEVRKEKTKSVQCHTHRAMEDHYTVIRV